MTVEWRRGKIQRYETREHERREKSVYIVEGDLEKSLQAECVDERCYIFIMLDEGLLCGFFQMGFHVKCCLYVYLMNMFMLNECMMWIIRSQYNE